MSSVVRNEKEMLETVDGMECAIFMVSTSKDVKVESFKGLLTTAILQELSAPAEAKSSVTVRSHVVSLYSKFKKLFD